MFAPTEENVIEVGSLWFSYLTRSHGAKSSSAVVTLAVKDENGDRNIGCSHRLVPSGT